jgi:hypothetical protein
MTQSELNQYCDQLTVLREAVNHEAQQIRENEYLSAEQKMIQIEIVLDHYQQQRHLLRQKYTN